MSPEQEVDPKRGSNSNQEYLLEVKDLKVNYETPEATVRAINGVSLQVERGNIYGIVGESGCGKSTLAFAIIQYLDENGYIDSGKVFYRGKDLANKSRSELQSIWGNEIAMVYQDPTASLNPSMRVGEQIAEVSRVHEDLSWKEANEKAVNMLDEVHIQDPESTAERYSHQLSGGMKQRVSIAMSLMANPDLLILDEPTTNLDVTTEAKILDMVEELKDRFNAAMLYITHDLGVVARSSDVVEVMYAGEIIERSSVRELFSRPLHPYTEGLLKCIPHPEDDEFSGRLNPIGGSVPDLTDLPEGCSFANRCPYRKEKCTEVDPGLEVRGELHEASCHFTPLSEAEVTRPEMLETVPEEEGELYPWESDEEGEGKTLEINEVKKYFSQSTGWELSFRGSKEVKAVDGVSLDLEGGQTLGVVGESGCGKTTLARSVIGLEEITSGEIKFKSTDISTPVESRGASVLKRIQIIFQDPRSTLNPKKTIGAAVRRPLELHGDFQKEELGGMVDSLLEAVGLDVKFKTRYPKQLSGGQKQRVAVARAFASNPSLVLSDEPTSSLDVSIQATILNLLISLQAETDVSYMFISHDLSVVRYISDYIAVMYLGNVVEVGKTDEIFSPPYHPYTEALLSAIPVPDPEVDQKQMRLKGSVPSAINPPSGCVFHTRCPRKVGKVCEEESPPLVGSGDHEIYCHIPLEELQEVEAVL
jgi:peptide/nickel transport system ATP-binding protein